jgi:hypothetical protein
MDLKFLMDVLQNTWFGKQTRVNVEDPERISW